MYTVSKSFTFDSAHRLMGYDGPCAELHGHTYTATITFTADYLDEVGFVVDFADIKRLAKEWVDINWDHGTILCSEDPLIMKIDTKTSKIYILDKKNPTAESMAEHLFDRVFEMMPGSDRYWLHAVAIKETPTSEATYSPF